MDWFYCLRLRVLHLSIGVFIGLLLNILTLNIMVHSGCLIDTNIFDTIWIAKRKKFIRSKQ